MIQQFLLSIQIYHLKIVVALGSLLFVFTFYELLNKLLFIKIADKNHPF